MNWEYVAFSGLIDGNKMYLSDIGTNLVFRKNIDEAECVCIGEIPTDFSKDIIYQRRILKYYDELVFIPQMGGRLHFMNLNNGEVYFLDLFHEVDGRISDAIIVENTLYLFPLTWGGNLYSICLDTKKTKKEEWFKQWYKREIRDDGKVLFSRFVEKYGKIYTVKCETNYLIEIQLIKHSAVIHKIDLDDMFGIWNSYDGFWITCCKDGHAYQFDDEFNLIKSLNITKCDKRAFSQVVELKEHVYFIPAFCDFVYSYSIRSGFIDAIKFPEGCWEFPEDEGAKCFGYSIYDKNCVLYWRYAKGILWINDEENVISFEKLISENAYKYKNAKLFCIKDAEKTLDLNESINENKNYTINEFLCYLLKKQ